MSTHLLFKFDKLIFVLIFTLFSTVVFAQDKTVSITTTGVGVTRDAAIVNALKHAVEQSFGAFLSTRSNILNEIELSKEISSVSNGKIVKYDILNESVIDENKKVLTLKVTVSLNELVNFVQAKGGAVEIKGALFANNYLLLDIYKNNEITQSNDYFNSLIKSIENKKLFDTKLEASDPFKITRGDFAVPMHLAIKGNSTIASVASNAINFLKSISINEKNLDLYKKLNFEFYTLIINDGKDNVILYFRDQSTIKQLDKLYDCFRKNIKNIEISNDVKSKKLAEFGTFSYASVEAEKIGFFNFKKYNNYVDELFQEYSSNIKSGNTKREQDYDNIVYYDIFFSLSDLEVGFFTTEHKPSYSYNNDFENKSAILFINDFKIFKIAGEFKKLKQALLFNNKIYISNPGLLKSEKLQMDIFITDILDLNTLKNTSKYTVQ
jgi:hypothetical protein